MLKSRFKKVTVIAAVSAVAALLAGCAQNLNAMDNYAPAMNSSMVEYDVQASGGNMDMEQPQGWNTEEYSAIKESGFKNPRTEPLSTFSADVDTASYTNIRRYINNGEGVPEGAVRIEEMLNYFSYDYPEPEEGKAFSTSVEMDDCPWNENTKLLKSGFRPRR